MLDTIEDYTSIIITSDNCYIQYKSSHSFIHLQKLSNKLNIQIIRVYGIPGHGKNEVDCCSHGMLYTWTGNLAKSRI